jgi:hypothetical protein
MISPHHSHPTNGVKDSNSVGCRFKVYSGKVEMGKMPEKYDQAHILNSHGIRGGQ